MSVTKYTDCFNEVLPELPGVPVALAENAIRNAVIEFCQRSTIWRYTPDAQDISSGVSTYDLEPDTGADAVEIIDLSVDGDLKTPGEDYTQQNTTAVTLVFAPDGDIVGGLTMTLALAPRRNSSSFPAWLWAKYYEGIAAGAKCKLMRMPKKPWTDQQTALYYQSIFDAAAAGASADAARSLTRAAIRTTSQH